MALLKPSKGEILYNDNTVKNRLDKMGYMFQKDYLFEWLSVRSNVLLGLKIKKIDTKDNISNAENLLKNYQIDRFANHKPTELSGGMRQRVDFPHPEGPIILINSLSFIEKFKFSIALVSAFNEW